MNPSNYKMVSVIVPVYNTKEYLENCVTSILCQDYHPIEIILIDDGSSDGSDVVCDELSASHDNIIVLHKDNSGLSNARNSGIEIASGDFLMFVDSDDDLSSSDLISKNIAFFDDSIDIVQFPIEKIWPYKNQREFLCLTKGVISTEEEFLQNLLPIYQTCKINGSVCNKIFKRQVFEALRFKSGAIHEDSLMLLYVSENYHHLVLSDSGFYRYYIREKSINTSPHSFKWFSDLLVLLSSYAERCNKFSNLKEVRINIYFMMMNILRLASHTIKDDELSFLVQIAEGQKPLLGEFLLMKRKEPLQCIKALFVSVFGMKALLKILP